MRSTLLTAIASVPASDLQMRAKTAFYLAITVARIPGGALT